MVPPEFRQHSPLTLLTRSRVLRVTLSQPPQIRSVRSTGEARCGIQRTRALSRSPITTGASPRKEALVPRETSAKWVLSATGPSLTAEAPRQGSRCQINPMRLWRRIPKALNNRLAGRNSGANFRPENWFTKGYFFASRSSAQLMDRILLQRGSIELPGSDASPSLSSCRRMAAIRVFLVPQMQLQQNGLKLRLTAQPIPPPVRCDPFQIRPVLLNILL